ncbi:Hypothetical predicted protein [Mytilus galloprovincialis]|uniref:Uncharacterized protein n=1 Tax=Mytilus galloprovincialis TaxID=29158 RepID=A0A8B6EUX7_MYTGA|nr:Hypothetical predicted protein [Mytilus galloprovincialis]
MKFSLGLVLALACIASAAVPPPPPPKPVAPVAVPAGPPAGGPPPPAVDIRTNTNSVCVRSPQTATSPGPLLHSPAVREYQPETSRIITSCCDERPAFVHQSDHSFRSQYS